MTDKINFKKPIDILAWLDTALEKEKQKYKATPVNRDMIPGHEAAQGWGYVVAGYFLIEQSLKAVLHIRGVDPPKTHPLFVLFEMLPSGDQDVLRAYYNDFRHAAPGMSSFPPVTLDDFLKNLDGERKIGSFDWRYFPIEKRSGASMPLVSIDFMHEIAYGCVQLLQANNRGDNEANRFTYSWRLQGDRWLCFRDWLTVRLNSPGWGQEGDRIEILWGPDYDERYDYLVFEGSRIRTFFGRLPDPSETKLSVVDKRSELTSFDSEEGFRSIGVTVRRPPSLE